MSTVTRKLIAKELYVNRGFILSSSIAGLVSVLIAATGKTGFNIGSLTWITNIIALGVMLAIYGIQNERKENSLLFVLSLPLSPADYVRSKQVGLTLCYVVPWFVSSAAAIALVLFTDDRPAGFLPYLILLCTFFITNFSLVLCGALHATTEAVMVSVIIVTNMAVTLFMFLIGGIDAIHSHMWGPTPVWNAAFWTVLAVELVTLVVAYTLPCFVAARRRDFL
jgi:ABC-2 type transport system permease protein